MTNRAKGGGRKSVTRERPGKTPAKKTRPKKPYGRDDHRHGPGRSKTPKAKLKSEKTRLKEAGVDEDPGYGAGTRGHRWSRAPAVSAGGVVDRRQSYGRRATDRAPPESFTLQSEVRGDQRSR